MIVPFAIEYENVTGKGNLFILSEVLSLYLGLILSTSLPQYFFYIKDDLSPGRNLITHAQPYQTIPNETLWRGDVVIDQSEEENERYLSGCKVSVQQFVGYYKNYKLISINKLMRSVLQQPFSDIQPKNYFVLPENAVR